MKTTKSWAAAVAISLAALSSAWGHLDSLRINGVLVSVKADTTNFGDRYLVAGQTYSAGQTLNLAWRVEIQHAGYNVYFSTTGGTGNPNTAWQTQGTAASTANSFTMTVPNGVTTQGKIRIYQVENGAPAVCTYNCLETGNFNVQAASAVLAWEAGRLSLHRAGNTLALDFGGLVFRHAVVQVRDLNGALLGTAEAPAGSRELTLPMTGLSGGEAVFNLAVDGRPRASRLIHVR